MTARIGTQVFVLIDGDRKVMEFMAPDGVTRPLQVDIDFVECEVCGALLLPRPSQARKRHAAWHEGGADA